MKKIIVAFDNRHYSEEAMQFILEMHQLSRVSLTGIFLPQVDYSALWSANAGAMAGGLFVPFAEEEEVMEVKANIDHFATFCQQHKISYSVKKDFFDFTLGELRKETRFADLLVIGSESFYKSSGTEQVNQFLKDALHQVECPVLLVPKNGSFPQTNILAYDGTESSVFAIKQFAYLFPELLSRRTLVVYLNEEPESTMPEERAVKALVSRHFEQTAFLTLHIDAKKHLTTWLREQRGGILVSGAFGRSGASELFKRSFIYEAITDHQLPIFIAHK